MTPISDVRKAIHDPRVDVILAQGGPKAKRLRDAKTELLKATGVDNYIAAFGSANPGVSPETPIGKKADELLTKFYRLLPKPA